MPEASALQLNIDHLAVSLVAACVRGGATVATAESCTGGMISAAITAVPGASAVFPGSIVSYANEVKRKFLGVSETTLSSVGAVSRETASDMAAGARRALGADFAVAVTGIAGPSGGTPEKPVGLVWIGVASPRDIRTFACHFDGDRREIRLQTVEAALRALLDAVEGTI